MHPRQTILSLFLSVALMSVFIYTGINLLEPSLVQPISQPAAVSDFNSSLIAHYTFDDGTATDATGSHTGTVSGATPTEGKIGGALAFDGATNYVDLGDMTAVEGQTSLSVSMWVKNNASANVSGGDTMMSKEGSGADTLSLSWAQNEDISFCVVGSTSGVSCGGADTATATYVDGIPEGSGTNWNHVVGILDSGTVKVYVNGIQGGTTGTLSSPSQNSVHALKIGPTWAGSIDDVRIYNKALSTQEIADLYTLGGGVVGQAPPPPPVTPPTDTGTTPPTTPPVTPPTPPQQEVSVRSTAPPPVSWTPPIGIPEPPFGIRESHYMYQLGTNETCTTSPNKCYDFGSGLEPYRDAGAGPYTHYIDSSSPSCTNTSNPYGTKTKPRCGSPTVIPPGSVLEIRGLFLGGQIILTFNCTQDRPCWLRGPAQSSPPVIRSEVIIKGSYVTLENLKIEDRKSLGFRDHQGSTLDHASIRNSDLASVSVYGKSTDIVVYNNHIHSEDFVNLGPNSPEFKEYDHHGVATGGGGTDRLWIVDNDIHDISGDAVGNAHAANYTARNFYIGRNLLHDTGENSVDYKEVENVVISQNKLYNNYGPSTGSNGAAAVFHYGPTKSPRNLWFIFNEIYNSSDVGVQIGGDVTDPIYIVGNVIHDISNPAGGGIAIVSWNSSDIYIVNNTLYNNDHGVNITGGNFVLYLFNNIISNLKGGYHLALDYTAYRNAAQIKNNLFYQSPSNVKIKWGTPIYNVSQLISQVPGKCTGCLESNPLFNNPSSNDFSLQSGSPAINAADNTIMEDLASRFYTSFGIDIRKDFLGNNRRANTPWDIGAYEYGAVGGTQPPPTVITPPTDTTAPSLTGITATNITATGATISWNTSEAATTQVEYGLTTAYGNSTTRISTYANTHTQSLTNLQGNTLYHYRVISLDQAGNTGTSPDQTFTTTISTDNDGDGVLNTVDKCPATPSTLRAAVNIHGCPLPRFTRFNLSVNPSSQDITSIPAFDISNTYGKISYPQTTNPYKLVRNTDEQMDIDSYLTMSKGLVSLDSTRLPELNKQATITLYNLSLITPKIMRDGVLCSTCTLISYTNGTLIFSVTGFSTYTILESSDITPTTHTVSVTKMGSGSGTVTGAGISCGSDCSESITGSITLTASPSSRSVFDGWSGGYCTGTSSCTFTPSSDATVIATFTTIPVVTPPEPSTSPVPPAPIVTTRPSVSPRSIPSIIPRSSPVVTSPKTLPPDLVAENTEPLPTFTVPTLWEQFVAYIHHIYISLHDLLTLTWTRIWSGVTSLF